MPAPLSSLHRPYHHGPHHTDGLQFISPTIVAVSSFSFLTWDMCVTLDDEVELIWRRPWSHLKSVYLFIRLAVLFAKILDVWLSIVPEPPGDCSAWITGQVMTTIILMLVTQSMMTLRASSIYRNNRIIFRGVRILFLLHAVVVICLYFIFKPKNTPDGQCIRGPKLIQGSPNAVEKYAYAVPPLIFDFILLGLTLCKFHTSIRNGWRHVPVISKFVRDGVWAYALPSMAFTTNLCLNLSGDGQYIALGTPWITAVNGFTGYRLILSILRMLRDAEVDCGSVEMESVTLDSRFDTGTNINSPRTDRLCEGPICVVTRIDVERS